MNRRKNRVNLLLYLYFTGQEKSLKIHQKYLKFLLSHIKIISLGLVWLFAVLILLTNKPKVLDTSLNSVTQKTTSTLNFPGTTTSKSTSKYFSLSIEGYFTDTDNQSCLTCILISCKVYGYQKSYQVLPEVWKLIALNDVQNGQKITKQTLFEIKNYDNELVNVTVSIYNNQTFNVPVSVTYDSNISSPIYGVLLATFVLIFLYGLIIWDVVHRTFAAVLSAILSIACLALINDRPTAAEVVAWVDFETILLLFSMMIVVSILAESGVFNYLAVVVYRVTKGQVWPLIHSLCILTTLISAFLDNVTTTLLIAPITITLCEVMNLNPVPILVAVVIHANIGGTATAVGDPPNIIITSNEHVAKAGINFISFTAHMGVGVVLCVIATAIFLRIVYRDESKLRIVNNFEFCNLEIEKEFVEWEKTLDELDECPTLLPLREKLKVKLQELNGQLHNSSNHDTFESKLKVMERLYPIKDKKLLIKSALVLNFVILLFLFESVPEIQSISLSGCALIGVLILPIITRKNDIDQVLTKVEWSTLLFFAAMFITMEAVNRLGLIALIGDCTKYLILAVPKSFQLLLAVAIILWVSGIVSAFVDSIPVTTMMVKVLVVIAENKELSLPLQPLIWALAFGPCLGGNGTLVGASANVVCASVANRRGYQISFIEFMKLGFPVMFVTLIVINLYLDVAHSIFKWH